MAKGTIVKKDAVTRKKGYLYFVDGDGNVREAKMNRKGGTKGRKVCSAPKRKTTTTKKKKSVKKSAPRKSKKVVKRVVRRAKKRTTKK